MRDARVDPHYIARRERGAAKPSSGLKYGREQMNSG
jgi:hypothetical protein